MSRILWSLVIIKSSFVKQEFFCKESATSFTYMFFFHTKFSHQIFSLCHCFFSLLFFFFLFLVFSIFVCFLPFDPIAIIFASFTLLSFLSSLTYLFCFWLANHAIFISSLCCSFSHRGASSLLLICSCHCPPSCHCGLQSWEWKWGLVWNA